MTSSVPAPRARRQFPEIAAVSWEHPADRAALQTLRAIPGVDDIIRRILAMLGGERGIRLLFQGNAIRVGPHQFPKLWHLHTEITTTFDWSTVPEVYVSQTPFFNAGAYGIDSPFIVVHSAAIELLDDDELRVLLSHELGHVISGHALYRTIAAILAMVSLGVLPVLGELVVLPIRLAFLEWSRKSELSADRAGLLGAQDILVALVGEAHGKDCIALGQDRRIQLRRALGDHAEGYAIFAPFLGDARNGLLGGFKAKRLVDWNVAMGLFADKGNRNPPSAPHAEVEGKAG